jgi:cardiolipin synthase
MRHKNQHPLTGFVIVALLLSLLVTLPPTLVRSASTTILITGVYYDTYLTGEPDEAFRLMNISGAAVGISGWTITDGEGTITLAGTLAAGQSIWLAREAVSFALEFGFSPDFEYGADTNPAVPNLAQSGNLVLANTGDELVLKNSGAAIVDSVVYGAGNPASTDWSGPSIYPYSGALVGIERFAQQEPGVEGFGIEGQILYRKLDQATGLPVPDTDTVADWAQATDDDINGKKVQYPGWDLDRYFFTDTFTETATITYAVAPDNIYETVLAEIGQATTSLYYEGYTFHNAHLADAIVARMTANPGITVTILLEGEPVGGITDQEKWICQQIENAGGQVYFLYNDSANDVHDRYNYQHGKWMIIDGERLLTGSENLTYTSMPADDKSDGTEGNRGVWLITDAPSAVAHALDVFRHDLDPTHHRDLFRWTAADPTYGAPTPGFIPDYSSGGTTYAVQFPTPLTNSGTFFFEMVQSPDNNLRDLDSLLGMVARAGSGDTVLVQQLYEYTFWGPTTSNPTVDPNPRLEAYIAAARRGAKVRLLLDSVYEDPGDVRGNTATCAYVNGIAAGESLDLGCKLANPAGTGIHNKMVLVQAGGKGYVHTGSINGSENSSKANREFAVQVQSDAAYNYLAGVFWYDWGEYFVYLPMVLRSYEPTQPPPNPTIEPPAPPDLYIQTLRYDTSDEYVQIANRGGAGQLMTGWKVHSVVGEQWYTFPDGYVLGSSASVSVHSGTGAFDNPPADLLWTTMYIWNNAGDKAILYDASMQAVDTLCYGTGCP